MTKRKTVKSAAPSMPRGRRRVYEWYGFRPGQPVTIGTAGGKYPKVKGNKLSWVFRAVVVEEDGTPIEVEVFGGKPMYEKLRTFPFDRLDPPKTRRRRKAQTES